MKIGTFIVVSTIFVIVSGFLIFSGYLVYAKAKGQIEPIDQPITSPPNSGTNLKILGLIVAFVIILAGGGLVYVLLYREKQALENQFKDTVAVDRAKLLFKEKVCKEYGLPFYIDASKNLRLIWEEAFNFIDQNVFFVSASGEKFLKLEFLMNAGKFVGVHTAIIPLDRGEKALLAGEWTLHHHTNSGDFKLLPRVYPISSIIDKEERRQFYLADQLSQGELSQDVFKELFKKSDPVAQAQANPSIGQGMFGGLNSYSGNSEEQGGDIFAEPESVGNYPVVYRNRSRARPKRKPVVRTNT